MGHSISHSNETLDNQPATGAVSTVEKLDDAERVRGGIGCFAGRQWAVIQRNMGKSGDLWGIMVDSGGKWGLW
jgi:hypothetical protein